MVAARQSVPMVVAAARHVKLAVAVAVAVAAAVAAARLASAGASALVAHNLMKSAVGPERMQTAAAAAAAAVVGEAEVPAISVALAAVAAATRLLLAARTAVDCSLPRSLQSPKRTRGHGSTTCLTARSRRRGDLGLRVAGTVAG